jgi:Fic family protein
LLYLSLYLKQNRSEYYRLLSAVRDRGDWEAWTMFFLEGVASAAREATETARALFSLVSRDRHRVLSSARSSVAAARLFELLPRHPVVTVKKVTQLLAMTKPSAGKAVHVLVDSGVLVETSGRGRDRTFAYAEYLGLLRGGTE